MILQADVRQITALAAEFGKAAVEVRKPVSLELREAAKRVRRRGRENVRKRTGKTARSITYSSKNRGLTYEVGPRWFVGRFLEHGTVNMSAYPFMEPAIAQETDLPNRVAERAAEAMFTPQRLA